MKEVAKTHERAMRGWETRRRNLKLKRIVRAISIRQPYAEMIPESKFFEIVLTRRPKELEAERVLEKEAVLVSFLRGLNYFNDAELGTNFHPALKVGTLVECLAFEAAIFRRKVAR